MNYTDKTPRRIFFKDSVKQTIGISAGLTVTAALLQSFRPENAAEIDNDHAAMMTEKDFRNGVIGPAELSKVTSQIAVEKATNKNALEFAGFELTEAIAVTTVLKDLHTAVPKMTEKANATLEKIKTAPKGPEFDKAYIQAQNENHVFLQDLAQKYLDNSKDSGPAENQGRHLATLALATFKEHVAITARILGELGS